MLENFDHYVSSVPLFAILLAYAGGVLTSFTPCLFPVIPITIGVLGVNQTKSKLRAFSLSVVYVCGMAFVYAILGIIAGLTGKLFGSVSVHPITNLIVANVCILFGLSMLDVITIPMPSFLTQRRITTGKEKGFFGVFFMGATAGTVVAPCTAPVLGTLLTFVGSVQNLIYGSLLLFAFAFGLGTLLIIIGTFSTILSSIPKQGTWMMWIKKILGIGMIIVAEYYLVRAGTMMTY